MNLIRLTIERPVAMSVGVMLLTLFGLVGLGNLPVQLTPDIETPKIQVQTIWPGASPYEIEKDILEPQELVLKSLRGLDRMDATARNDVGILELRFELGTEIDEALLRVTNKLGEVPGYPQNVERPVILSSGANAEPIIWSVISATEDAPHPVDWYQTFFENDVRPLLERVKGVGSLFTGGGRPLQVDVILDPEKLARYDMGIMEVLTRFSEVNQNISAGLLPMDKKKVRVRTLTRFENLEDPLDVVMRDDGVSRVLLRDIAEVTLGQAPAEQRVMQNFRDVMVVGFRKIPGANVVDMTHRVHETVKDLNAGILKAHGLKMEVVFDQMSYIEGSIENVQNNIFLGGTLAVLVLFFFLKSARPTLTISLAIPISAIGTFLFLWLSGRNINVVSLAGISFAVGMLVDNAIVVLENIDRYLKKGLPIFEACARGAEEVVGAVIASTATTVAVFLPIIFMEEEAGQLFRDIAIAISSAIVLSLIVSVLVIPSVMHVLYSRGSTMSDRKLPTDAIGETLASMLLSFSDFTLKSGLRQIVTVLGFTILSLGTVMVLMPKAEYLPQGNMNFVLGILIPPPGYTVEKMEERGDFVFEQVKSLFDGSNSTLPQIESLFYVGSDEFNVFGGSAVEGQNPGPLVGYFMQVMNSIPDVFGFAFQASLFASDMGEGRSVEVIISSDDAMRNVGVAGQLFGTIMGAIPGSQIQPSPSLEVSYPEASFLPNRTTLTANGLSEQELGVWVDVIMEGRKISEYSPEGQKKIDIIVRADKQKLKAPEDILKTTIANAHGQLIRIGDISSLEYGAGLNQISRREGKRTIRLIVQPPIEVPLQAAMDTIRGILEPMSESGQFEGMLVEVGGQASKLEQTLDSMKLQLGLAVLITYLLLSALMESYFFSLIIMFSVPLSAGGGFVGLWLVNEFIAPQSFDIISMLGFVILVGTVVNNAILIVYQSLQNVRKEGMGGLEAIQEALRTRIKPIFMSTMTSVLGLAPMVFATGAGSELYRGIGSVVLGGLLLATVFSVIVIPAMTALCIRAAVHSRDRAEENRQKGALG